MQPVKGTYSRTPLYYERQGEPVSAPALLYPHVAVLRWTPKHLWTVVHRASGKYLWDLFPTQRQAKQVAEFLEAHVEEWPGPGADHTTPAVKCLRQVLIKALDEAKVSHTLARYPY